ncbi:single-stranded-DNA-specific exonuclease RecJ [Parahalioglobus pacificus]|uniref:Single-stranded-DNA-specific exonuclease RecJ n=1 Tax=Parahalioglobus pacificus TaxID=930806 RepID=A0A919CID6_9GAMM|nr:single-stranded-DNA-specific exonuclease RecJ [Halioglobus pacificus]GHD26883.1 single-stranded-DNA-specific exonuclease RecJ [Halioglobus pacificus]
MNARVQRRAAPEQVFDAPGLPPLLARVYAARGIASANELELTLAHLLPPSTLKSSEAAGRMLADALADEQHILVVGDYDADGATSTALALTVLRAMGAANVSYLVPNRFEYGYGLTPAIVELAKPLGPDIIVTVDNGISSLEGVAAARAAGIATLVTDHHLAGRQLPDADVIVNPNQPGCNFASKSLAGVGVMFYCLLALRAELRQRGWFSDARPEPNLADYLDLVALGTVADVVPLDRNNRILVDAGLKRIRAGRACHGIAALLEVANRQQGRAVASDLGFAAGPRLNAAGRLDDISVGIECLLAPDAHRARALAADLDGLNRDRRAIELGMQRDAQAQLDAMVFDDAEQPPVAYCLYDAGWHEGVVGILASRIKDRVHRPTIAFADGAGGELKGSARSIKGIHIRDVLDAVATRNPGLVSKFGGHAMAAGLSLPAESLDAFRKAFIAEVARHAEDVELDAVIESDGALSAAEFDLQLAEALRFAGPWGQHFPEPVFDGVFNVVDQRLVGSNHLKMVLSLPGESTVMDAIQFNVDTASWPQPELSQVRAAYRLDVNQYRGRNSLQLMIDHLEPV